jgi:uncharacterized GH25 family protein
MPGAQPISGVVLDPNGNPVEGARVYVTASPAPIPDVALLTGPDGAFVIGASAAGKYRIAASAEGFETGEAEFDTGAPRTVELRLRRAV